MVDVFLQVLHVAMILVCKASVFKIQHFAIS